MERNFMKWLFFVIIMWIGAGINVFSQTLWQDSKYGMSLNEIKMLYPNAITSTDDRHFNNGSEELLRINDIRISNEPFSGGFYFKGNRLTRVYFFQVRNIIKHKQKGYLMI